MPYEPTKRGSQVEIVPPIGSDDEIVVAIVSRVNEDGTINAHVFYPRRPAAFVTGLRHVEDRDALPEDSAERNLAAWAWPTTE